jgi:hypothetical protein
MILHLETRHDLTPNEVEGVEDRLYEHNSHQPDAMMAKDWAL